MPGPHRGLLLEKKFQTPWILIFVSDANGVIFSCPVKLKFFHIPILDDQGSSYFFGSIFFIYQKSYSLWNSWQDTILAFHMKTITIQNIKYICPTVLVGYITTVCSCSWGNFSQMRELPFWQGKVPSFLFAFPSFLLSFCYQRNFHLVVHNLNLALWVKICKKNNAIWRLWFVQSHKAK